MLLENVLLQWREADSEVTDDPSLFLEDRGCICEFTGMLKYQ